MAKKVSSSKLRSQLRRIEQQQKQALNNYNREARKYNRNVKKAISDYNAAVRRHNAKVKRNKQIITRELKKLESTSLTRTRYTISTKILHECYEAVERKYPEGASITEEQERILDLINQEQANSLQTENYILNDQAPEETTEDIEIGNKLAMISEDLNNRWHGAVFALNPNNPDATRHFCTSTREIFTEFLEIKAPDKEVFKYNPDCDRTERGNATRREKIKYIMRDSQMDDTVISYVEEDINNIIELNSVLSGGTHGPAGKFSMEKLIQVKKRVEQGIYFLCEISG